jgi:Omp85 superfamily domain
MQHQHIAIPRSVPGRASAGWLAVVTVGLALVSSVAALAQGAASAEPERRTVTVGHYAASAPKRLVWGSGYRNLWMTPVSVEVLDFANEAGGLRPVRRVGGQQTRVLALEGRDGRSYSFRGLVKDTSHLLDFFDPMLQQSVVVKLLDDLMSAQHPAGELVASGILDAAEVPSPRWRLVVLPDVPALAEFGAEFAGAVGVFGEYPQPAKGSQTGFMGATEIIDHLEFYKRLEAGDAAADSRALLRARLVDVLLGDWDRHRRQWRWAKTNDSPLFTPIPEDRDQAFSRYEGYLLARTRARDPRFQNFGPRYEGIGGLTFNGWDQDRRLLAGFTREDFVETARQLASGISDRAIEEAVRRMPPEWYAVDGKRLVSDLRARRNALPEAAEKYYRHLAKDVDVYMTDRSERVLAARTPNGDMEVTVRALDGGGQAGPTTFHRVFHASETEEVRFYALGGDDTISVTGGDRGPRVRMIGGKGDDTLEATGAGKAKLSDSDGHNRAIAAAVDDKPYHAPDPPTNAPWIPARDFTRETWLAPAFSYNADVGFFLGYSLLQERYGFRKSPYASAHRLTGGYAFQQSDGHVEYEGDFRRENSRSSFNVHAYASSVEVLRFYGFGNETEATQGQKYYRVHANQFLLYPSLRFGFGKGGELHVGPALKYTSNDQGRDEYINTANPYGAGDYGALGAHAVLSWDARDNKALPRRGVFAAVRGTWFAQTWDVDSDFGQVNGNINGYLPVGGALTLAVRAGGKKVFGNYPYMEAAALGQGGLDSGVLAAPENTLRGYRARRFVGDEAVYFNGDMRLRISGMNIGAPGSWGLTASADTGRVWLEGESSDTWHSSVGGGLWFSWLTNRAAASIGVSHSSEDNLVYFVLGSHF